MADVAVTDLDLRFGECRDGELKEGEANAEPIEFDHLDSKISGWLTDLLDWAQKNPYALAAISHMTLIWAVAETGEIRICIEQSCNADFPEKRFPRSRNVEYPRSFHHLGHPMLVDGARARISGELYLDQEGEEFIWTLSNKSGRFGFDRKLEHLINVSDEFQALGVYVKLQFLA
ncbi:MULTISPECIES: hypothetical protein [Rhodopseudomonas]|uniref:Uncharacterized protein n=1 Tax=Rhodopseudomonas palustris TaxID=1076 RepID=A0A0D7E4F8_RHOPL|nr:MULTISPECIES: hypothetical protein [Rhodopseudomonas]KIZ35754.1 hypothetical protein OO17_25435 [Rhodopseudomonas palustris]MDF3810832.1 hypothetical protein [Rhodopseudomonas sp. BAL398]WOK15669.1 hypothetical protein RBJ75_15940 [Rhodopseudomonas sp. BAL398]